MKSSKEKYKICETIVRILDGSVTPEEFQSFEKKLAQDAEIRSMYMSVLEAYAYMQRPGRSFQVNALGADDEDDYPYQKLWESLAKSEKEAPAIEIQDIAQKPELIQKVTYEKAARPFKKTTFIPVILAVAAALMMLIFVRFAPVRGTFHGQITETYQAVFGGSASDLQRGGYLADEPILLEKGLVRIQMDDGTSVLLEAPAELRLEADDQVFLIEGKLTADVPKSGIGFTVRTPSASIVDYGTEFGVSIDQYAKTEAHVLDGNVEMRLGSNLRVFDKAIRLSANQAGSVSGQSLNTIPARVNQFTYQIPSSFENHARSLDPLLYFRLKKDDINTFSEATGSNGFELVMAPDQSIHSGPLLGGNKLSYALQMSGQQGIAIQNVLPLFADTSGDYTVACWVRFDQIQNQIIWSNLAENISSADGDGSYHRILWINEQGKLEHTAFYSERKQSDRKVNSIAGLTELNPDQWYFISVTHAKGKYKSLYINGRLAAVSGGVQGNSLEKYSELTFGRAVEELAPAMKGAISEILFFNRDLTQKENNMLYESAAGN